MKTQVLLAMLPVAVFSTATGYTHLMRSTPPREESVYVKMVTTERIVRPAADTFDRRWPTVVFRSSPVTVVVTNEETNSDPVPIPTPRPEIQEPEIKRPRRGDICSRHGMRKVHYGKRWRCRR